MTKFKSIVFDFFTEISLLHLGAKKVLTHKPEDNKPKKNKDGSFLVNFKIPYIVTPVVKKKKPKAKTFQPKKVKKPHHIKKFHHRIVHHKKHYHHAHVQDVNRPPAAPQPSYSRPPAPGSYKLLLRAIIYRSLFYSIANHSFMYTEVHNP